MAIVNSLFATAIEKWLPKMVAQLNQKVNDRKNEPNLLFKSALTESLSTDMRWDSNDFNGSVYLADVVSLDSSLPLRKRDSLTRASGFIPKVGHKTYMGEKELSDLLQLQAKGTREAEVVKKVLADVPRLVKGIEWLNEVAFEQALSTGYTLFPSVENAADSIRLNFGYKDDHFLKTAIIWGNANFTPLTDIENMIKAADNEGRSIGVLWIPKAKMTQIRNSTEGKLLAANYRSSISVVTNNVLSNLPTPPQSVMIEAMREEYGVDIIVIDNHFRRQTLSGGYTNATGWDGNNIVGTPAGKVGRLVYSQTVEEQHPVNGVNYEKSGSYILVSKWGDNDPIKEYTGVQALCCPVIDGAEDIFVLQTNLANNA